MVLNYVHVIILQHVQCTCKEKMEERKKCPLITKGMTLIFLMWPAIKSYLEKPE